MSTYEPGTVAMVTAKFDDPCVAFRHGSYWYLANGRTIDHTRADHVVDVRPLVVLDLSEIPVSPSTHAALVADYARETGSDLLGEIARQIEAQTKPPRIPEPGLYGVIRTEDAEGLVTYRWHSHGGWHGEDGSIHDWDDLPDPTLVREGLS